MVIKNYVQISLSLICDAMIIYDTLHKWKVFLDVFAEGLEVFSLKRGITAFPNLFLELFVAPMSCTLADVLAIICMDVADGEARRKVAGYYEESSAEGM